MGNERGRFSAVLISPGQGRCPTCGATLVAAIHGELGERLGECMNCGALVALRLASLSDPALRPLRAYVEMPVRCDGKLFAGD